jgi:hypothetical protein
MHEYSVMVEAAVAVDDDAVETVLDALAPLGGVVHLTATRWGARVSVEAPDARAAALHGWAAWKTACRQTAVRGRPVVHLEVTAAPALDWNPTEARPPELVGVSELAGLLGVTRQRASQLATHERFPRPVAHLASGPVWDAAAVRAFLRGEGRGR